MLNLINALMYRWLVRSLFWDKLYTIEKIKYHQSCERHIKAQAIGVMQQLEMAGMEKEFPKKEFHKPIEMHMKKVKELEARLKFIEERLNRMLKIK